MTDFFHTLLSDEAFKGFMLLVGAAIAISSIYTSRLLARKKQSADLLFNCRNDRALSAGHQAVKACVDANDQNMASYARKDRSKEETAVSIRYILNHYEYIAIGIQAGIYDESMLRNAMHGTVTRLYHNAKPFIDETRRVESRATIFQELQWLAERWSASPLKKKKCVSGSVS